MIKNLLFRYYVLAYLQLTLQNNVSIPIKHELTDLVVIM